ncbi:MAG: ABC transporter permease [Bacteriovoracia bacterium]
MSVSKLFENIQIKKRIFQNSAISILTFKELIREKVLWSSLLFGVLCVGLAWSLSRLSFVEDSRIALDFGLTSISLIGGLLSIMLGANLVAKELESKTVYLILAKPIRRWQFISGRLIGLNLVLLTNMFLMAGILILVLVISGGEFKLSILQSLLLQFSEWIVLAAVACFFSCFSTVTLSVIFSTGIWVIGHAIFDIKLLIRRVDPPELQPVLEFLSKILPDLGKFDIKVNVSHNLFVGWSYVFSSIFYALWFTAFVFTLTCFVFSKRDL